MSCNSECGSCGVAGCGQRKEDNSFAVPLAEGSTVKKVIGVVSGKGGVGKSLITGLLASRFAKTHKTAILDADITGPSIPKMFGITERAAGSEKGLIPVETATGIKLMSINLLLESPEMPVIWRGPVIAGVVKQFWGEVLWGDVDYMFVDMPPGTGDVPLTVFQSLPISGIIVVASPQELVSMIVGKAVGMANMMNIPILGIVENMSYVECPDCGKKIYLYGESHVEEAAKEYGLDLLGSVPVDPLIAKCCDNGELEKMEDRWLDAAAAKIIAT
ncbi:MAG: Mrp/NBP35 family ATP-binding protein [Oscillospiraceae bacterium]|nr:Mrp/NBP35 family ATP-binding protein [Oscillospiraceae bacterium]